MKRLSLVVSLLCCSSHAQQIWKVNCNGGAGVHFTDIPQAVAAAAPNDEIRIYVDASCPTAWPQYTAPIIDKPLRLVGFNVGGVPGNAYPTGIPMRGVLLIIGIAAGEQVVCSNLSTGTNIYPGALVGLDCAGKILLEDVPFVASGYPDAYVHFERCADVVMRGCEVILGGAPLRVIDSNLLLSWSSVSHASPGGVWPPFFSYQQTAEGLRMTNSTVTLVGTLIRGSRRFNYNPWQSWLERPAAYVESGTLRLGPGSSLLGGSGGNPSPTYSYIVEDPATGSVEEDSRATVYRYPNPVLNCCPTVPKELPVTYSRWHVAGESSEVYAYGPRGGFAMMLFGDWARYPTATPFGALAIDPAYAQILDIVPLSATHGFYQWNPQVPANAVVAHAFAYQALTLSQIGVLELSVPSVFAIGWPHGVIP